MQFTARRYEAKSGVVAPLQRLMHLWRAYEGPERFDCLSIGKVARWGQIRPQDALSLHGNPQIFNTDQGSQFTCQSFTDVLVEHQIAISMDGRGSWRD